MSIRGRRAALFVVVVWLGVLAFAGVPALAAIVYPKVGEITEAFTEKASAPTPEAVAVDDQNGHIYVADSGSHVIRDYPSAADTSPTLWDGASTSAGAFTGPLAVAVENSTGDVYVSDATQKVIYKFDQDGNPIASFGDGTPAHNGQLTGLQTPAGSFSPPEPGFESSLGIAVDQATGDLYVLDVGHKVIDVFDSAGAYLQQFAETPGQLYGCGGDETGLAVNAKSGELLVANPCDHRVYRFDLTTGSFVATIDGSETPTGGFGNINLSVAASDSSGSVYVTDAAHGVVDVFDSSAAYQSQFVVQVPPGGTRESIAVDQAGGDLYLAARISGVPAVQIFRPTIVPDVSTKPVSALTVTSATLNGEVGPVGLQLSECFFEYGTTKAYGETAPCKPAPASIPADEAEHPVEAHIEHLKPGATYHYRLVATNANAIPSQSRDQVFFTGASIDSTSVSVVSASSATLETELNPHGLPTTYHFEYDTIPYAEGEPPHGTATLTIFAGSGEADIARSAQVQNLSPATVYHYRAVAENSFGTVEGPEQSFITQPALSGAPLLDGRVWEMVSPPEKSGAGIKGINELGEGALQASADGTGLAYTANSSFGQEAPGNRSISVSQFLAFRGANGWSTKDVTTPREDVVGLEVGRTSGYEVFSQDLSFGAVQPRGITPLSPLATETTPYLRAENGEFLPLVDSLDVPPETVFDGKIGSDGLVEDAEGGKEPEIEGGSPDLHSVVIASCFKLTRDAFNYCGNRLSSLYVWHEGALQLASILPNEKSAGGSSLGGNHQKRHAVSEDGTRLVFSASGGHLYLRDMALAKTVQLDLPERGVAGGVEGPQFEDMSADGFKVFFTDSARLTKDSNADNDHRDLYMCEILLQGEAVTCALKDLSVGRNTGEAGAVLGASLGADSSGRYIYFVANGALTPGGAPGDCQPSTAGGGNGTCGLYLYDTVTGTIKLVTTLSGADSLDWAGSNTSTNLNGLTARVSPNGRFLAFMSQRSLTGYDNRDAISGQPDQEVYLYDRFGNGGEGKLVCASCNPSGGRPRGVEIVANAHSLLNEENVWRGGTWLAAAIPGWTPFSLEGTLYQSRYLSDSGRLFFNSTDALVPRDSNGTVDVYEYEPPQGEGQPASNNCKVSSLSYSHSSEGCVDLVSTGSSPEESVFLDASESGDDTFFLTASQLVPADFDSSNDIYDARVGGVVSESVKPPACEGDACQSPVSAPEDPTPGSLTFQGPGNPLPLVSTSVKGKARPTTRAQKLARTLKACAHKPKRKRTACERQALRSYGPVGKAKKSNRGAHR
jgi:hypothetical protein